jgi:nitrile hydratase accessory protein
VTPDAGRRTAGIDLAALPRIPRDDAGPLFRAPWEAQAFAMAVKLHEAGHFTWREWADRLAAELAAAAARGEPDDGTRYYEHWLAALEKLVADKGLVGHVELDRRADEWAAAARATPHGQPIRLAGRAE